MSGTIRQSELFAGQDWRVLYRAFTTINFNASDPPSINRALREYIRLNYPEDFNDWIESSEFVAIIDLLSWLAGTLAFKTDIAARENFLETAEARESILRLARFLSYNPRRNTPARGILKIIEVETDDDVEDGFGRSLASTPILWDDPNDLDWFERFTTVLNAAMIDTNPFGVPLKQGTAAGARIQLYRLNNVAREADLSFNASVSGDSMVFEAVDGDFDEFGGLFERPPLPTAAMHFYYLSDGNGYSSAREGFFLHFKQGTTGSQTFRVDVPIENQVLDVDASGVNQDDVWVQTVDDNGSVLTEWSKVPALYSENISYNSISLSQRNIFSVITRDEDRISLRFSDGRFGNAPVGTIRTIYRISNGLQYQIRPQEIERVTLTIPYYNRRGARRSLRMTVSLQESVTNATPRETDEQVRRRAPLVYGAQNRMVSGEDYNVFPLQSNLALKIKAVNRVYSGQSRYTRLTDPTGTYEDVNVFAEDGILFSEPANVYTEVPVSLNRTPQQVVEMHIRPILRRREVAEAMRAAMLRAMADNPPPENLTWNRSTASLTTSTGWFSVDSALLYPGAMLDIQDEGHRHWVAILSVRGAPYILPPPGAVGPVTLAAPVNSGATIHHILPRFIEEPSATAVDQMEQRIERRLSFTLWYDFAEPTSHWTLRDPQRHPGPLAFSGTAIPVATVNYVAGLWRIEAVGLRHVMESERSIEWYNDGRATTDLATGGERRDVIRVLRVNENLHSPLGRALGRDFALQIGTLWRYGNGDPEPHRILVSPIDSDEDGYPDDPDVFVRVFGASPADSLLFWERTEGGVERPFRQMVAYATTDDRLTDPAPVGTIGYECSPPPSPDRGTFWRMTDSGWTRESTHGWRIAHGRGPNVAARWVQARTDALIVPRGEGIAFQWKHRAASDRRIDPATTNVHDIFVLTSDYDFRVRAWLSANGTEADFPVAPTELDLRIAFREFEQFRMFSDQIVWRPVRYKTLFGRGASDELRAQFKVVKLPGTSMSDGEVRSRVVRAMDTFFSVDRWDFGETFYFTELAAYVHQQLAGVIGSFVIVPLDAEASFGDGFEVRCRPDELFLSTARIEDVTIIGANTPRVLRMR